MPQRDIAISGAPHPAMASGAEAVVDDPALAGRLAEVLRAAAHPVRLRLVAALGAGELTVTDLGERLRVRQPVVSQQLRLLRATGLVAVTRRHGFAFYRLAEPALVALVECLTAARGAPEVHHG